LHLFAHQCVSKYVNTKPFVLELVEHSCTCINSLELSADGLRLRVATTQVPTQVTLRNMPRAFPVYNAISTSETVPFQISSGERKEFVVWQDIDSGVKLVKCDLCCRFMPLQGQSMSTSSLKRHRNGAGCERLQSIKQDANQISAGSAATALSFINTFQTEEGPSNVHLPCEFMPVLCFNLVLYY
jgi:hypothetical protein